MYIIFMNIYIYILRYLCVYIYTYICERSRADLLMFAAAEAAASLNSAAQPIKYVRWTCYGRYIPAIQYLRHTSFHKLDLDICLTPEAVNWTDRSSSLCIHMHIYKYIYIVFVCLYMYIYIYICIYICVSAAEQTY